MEINVIASTKQGYILSKEEAIELGAKAANICYTEKNWEEILKEPIERTMSRAESTMKNGHHSVYGHPYLVLYIEGLPKILAMILNNEKVYTTSEKSARYTEMKPSKEEMELYNKWIDIFKEKITEKYPKIDAKQIEKLALENARYMISVFTPTKMMYSTNFGQLNYIMHWFNDFVENAEDTDFNKKLKESMKDFNNNLKDFYAEDLEPSMKKRNLTLFSKKDKQYDEYFGDVYSTSYLASFAHLAQAHRHRTINYVISPIKELPTKFFVPVIIEKDEKLKNEWLEDIKSVAANYPQGTLLDVNERGIFEDFISKAYERVCGAAQWEIWNQTNITLNNYYNKVVSEEIKKQLGEMLTKKRCGFPKYKCTQLCNLAKNGYDPAKREI